MQMQDEGRHIVVVDDSPEFLSFMEYLLRSEGFHVRTANSLERLPECLTLRRPDLVITDVRLPSQPPFAVLHFLRSQSSTASIPVLLCTGAVNEVSEHADLLSGSDVQILTKPFDVEKLISTLDAILSKQAALPLT